MRARDKKCGWTILAGSLLLATAACALANSQASVALAEEITACDSNEPAICIAAYDVGTVESCELGDISITADDELYL
jgi:hypothetical protein